MPHTWNDLDAFDDTPGYYRGIGWYAKALEVPLEWKGNRVFIRFEDAKQEAEVYLNGILLRGHKGGYTAFGFDLSSGGSPESEAEARIFDVSINGKTVLDDLNLEADYGSLQAVTFDYMIHEEQRNGILVDFQPVSGEAPLSGIRIRRMN